MIFETQDTANDEQNTDSTQQIVEKISERYDSKSGIVDRDENNKLTTNTKLDEVKQNADEPLANDENIDVDVEKEMTQSHSRREAQYSDDFTDTVDVNVTSESTHVRIHVED